MSAPTPRERFAAVRERVAAVPRAADDFAGAVVECRRGERKKGAACAVCPHLLEAVPAIDGRSFNVRCVYLEGDTVELLMTPPPSLVCISEAEPMTSAAAKMLSHRVRQLLVTSGEEVVGLLHARTLQRHPAKGPVGRWAERLLPVMPRTLPLGAAVKALADTGRHCALVVDGDKVVGLLTRGDLRRAGVPRA